MTVSESVDTAREWLGRNPIVDGHNDLLFELRALFNYDLSLYDVSKRQRRTQTDLPRLRDGGVGGQFWSVYVPGIWAGQKAVTATLEQIDACRALVAHYPDELQFATSADDVRAAWQAGRIASLMGAEGGHQIDESLGVLRMYHQLGVRYLTLTHNDNVSWADSATDQRRLGGLNDFGREVVAEMNRIGMLVDLSHVSTETMHDALSVTRAPVIFSHSSARALCDHVRNVPDDVLGELATNGGVCMVTFVPYFISEECRAFDDEVTLEMVHHGENVRDWSSRLRALARYAENHTRPVSTAAQVADHIEHVREVAGLSHVGIGGDFDGCDVFPRGLEDVAGYPALIAELIDRRWSEEEIAALTGQNILRVLADAARPAASASGVLWR